MPDPLVLAADLETELIERKSRFLTRLHRVSSVEEADALIRAARADHPDARHHCTALVLAPRGEAAEVNRSNDDGEPAGTAGMPMLQSRLHAVAAPTLLRRTELVVAQIEVSMADVGVAENAVRAWAAAHGALVEATDYGMRGATLTVLVAPEQLEDLAADTSRWSSGRAGA